MFLTLCLQFALASWQPSAIESVNKFKYGIDDQGFTESFEASMWGSTKAKPFLAGLIDSGKIQVPGVFKNPVPYTYYLQKKSIFSFDKTTGERKETVRIKKSPVMIYIPGIFNNVADAQSRRAMDDYKLMGYHVFVLPNPWSEDYIKADQNGTKPGDIVNEAKSLFAATQAVLKTIDASLVDGVGLTGASYGGFIVGAMSGLDTNNYFSRGTTIVGPPMDFRYSLPYMDSFMDEELEAAYSLGYWTLAQVGSDFLFASLSSDISDNSRKHAKPFIAKKGFHESIIATIKLYDKLHKVGWVPKFADASEELAWEKSMRFMKYFTDYAPETLELLETDVANLNHWMNLTLSQGRSVRLFTTANDFLNPPTYPTKFYFDFMPAEIYLQIPTGGHLGFLALNWYNKFKKTAWAIR